MRIEKCNDEYYTKDRRLRKDAFDKNYRIDKKTEKSDDTKMRYSIIKEIEERIEKGEELDVITVDIASREEVKNHFSYFRKNGITKPINEFFSDWYKNKVKHKPIVDKLQYLDDRIR